MSRFFIDRPIFAIVLAIIVVLVGGLAIVSLPIAQYPAIAPPTISVSASYPGGSAKTLEDTVTQVIEQRMVGLDGLRFVSSSSDGTGSAQLTLTFEPGTDPDIAQVQVQNKLQLAMPQLPQEVQRQGVRVVKSASNFLMIAGFVSMDGSMTRNDIADYVVSALQDPVSRVPGVGDVQAFGSQYAMRVWMNPDKLISYKMTPLDVVAAIQAQNAQVSAGQFGGLPQVKGQQLNATITAQTRLQTAEEFAAIYLRVNPDGSQVRLRDVARVELAGESFDVESFYNGKPTAAMGIRLAVGANALNTADAIRARLVELEAFFPPGLKTVYPVDTTPFVKISIKEVIKTLVEAIVLVFAVMYLFLQSFRATLIPTLAVPVVLMGTFGVLAAFGYSINTLTMFGMVLAIGLLVDDAIVVVENVERIMHETGLEPREATRRSMDQITGALIGIALVLATVFIPMAFFAGSVGTIYRQFSITIVASMALSVAVAMILTPALCATLLKPGHGLATRGFFGLFNRGYERTANLYHRGVAGLLRWRKTSMLVFLALTAGVAVGFMRMPTGFLPEEDQGSITVQVLLPPGSTMERTRVVMAQLGDYFLQQEGDAVESVLSISGFGFSGRGQNSGLAFIRLRDWKDREAPELKASAVTKRATMAFSKIKEATVFAFVPPAISELGNATGFQLQLQDRAGLGHEALIAARDGLLELAMKEPSLTKVRQGGLDDTPQYRIEVDREKAAALGVALSDINATLAATWGGIYVNDFLDLGRTKRVYLQGDAPYRMQPDDINRWYVRNRTGEMVPFSAFASGNWTFGSPKLDRFGGYPTILIQGEPAPGFSSGDAMETLERLMTQMPNGVGHEWSGLSYEERMSGAGAMMLYALSLLVVFLCLAALYESWSIPIAVLLGVPLGVAGAVSTTLIFGFANDVYFQVGLLTTIGLSAKNAILIVEFAKELREHGKSGVEAALEAARERLRPILMTSLAFGLGVLPLALSAGAGAGAQNAIGVAVLGGVTTGTILGIALVPVFYVVVARRDPPPRTVAQVPAPVKEPSDMV
ncbi:efflux RND transporter permease subunit [Nannocystis bainbridge]|uniref:Efflux RND transporter permease subunit n=1 Tax=Nannocystis bainbridge TaxID=2995303 RepID=A0ABT5E0C5_9BACT|nr:efflux RND transporter permease subunit [Nannocystis bainbridge]MDC0718141.1 efflux RND transporter permease subunit [Nannocystis bainbridge]